MSNHFFGGFVIPLKNGKKISGYPKSVFQNSTLKEIIWTYPFICRLNVSSCFCDLDVSLNLRCTRCALGVLDTKNRLFLIYLYIYTYCTQYATLTFQSQRKTVLEDRFQICTYTMFHALYRHSVVFRVFVFNTSLIL